MIHYDLYEKFFYLMTIGDVLDILKGMASCKIEQVIAPFFIRSSYISLQIPYIAKFHTYWGEPQIPL